MKLFKDKNRTGYLAVSFEDPEKYFGHYYMCQTSQKIGRVDHQVDKTLKIYFKNFHTWEPYSEDLVQCVRTQAPAKNHKKEIPI